jgi:hypothetical protein
MSTQVSNVAKSEFHVLPNALERAVENVVLRGQLSEVLNGLQANPAGKMGALTVQQGTDSRVVVFIGQVPVGTDKRIRLMLNPDGGTSYKVSCVRNLPGQSLAWRTATVEQPHIKPKPEVKPQTAETPNGEVKPAETPKQDTPKPDATVTPQGVKANQPLPDKPNTGKPGRK